jgi:hypothetical protein
MDAIRITPHLACGSIPILLHLTALKLQDQNSPLMNADKWDFD